MENEELSFGDAGLIAGLRDCTLDPAYFDHEAHVRLAWICIKQAGVEGAIEEIRSLLKNYVAFLGAEDKYHETLTVAAVRTVNHFLLKSRSETFPGFIAEFPRLKSHFKALLAQHYTTDIFASEQARAVYLEPELLPFD